MRQVYGWLLDDTGRVLVQDVGTVFNLPGGSPEEFDGDDPAVTLRREAMEESQVTLSDVVHLGYEETRGAGGELAALVRMAGRIDEFLPRRPDPDGGRLFRRLMISLEDAPGLLGWGESGIDQARAAGAVAEMQWNLSPRKPTAAAAYAD
ncbi:NUDIX hydrolase [Nocardia terpenica]|uniref:NUDIX domain-containing protein n=1 Tax=Nocardia terpenica TaxID=455432 RepID=UPI002FE0531C